MSLREMAEIMANWLEGGEAPVIPPEWRRPLPEPHSLPLDAMSEQLNPTQEMLAAGVEAYLNCDPRALDPEEIVAYIFEGMVIKIKK